jgi:hypothetical protein
MATLVGPLPALSRPATGYAVREIVGLGRRMNRGRAARAATLKRRWRPGWPSRRISAYGPTVVIVRIEGW